MAAADHSTEDEAIRKLDVEWGDSVSRKDFDAVVGFYAPDGSVVWPGLPAAYGTADIRASWSKMFEEYQGLGLKFTPERIDFSHDYDIAIDFGKVDFGYDTPKGRVEQIAKYVVVWKKVDGAWKVLYDCYNGNTPDS
jgi:uncharacterized protein (TIGR02246 family)